MTKIVSKERRCIGIYTFRLEWRRSRTEWIANSRLPGRITGAETILRAFPANSPLLKRGVVIPAAPA